MRTIAEVMKSSVENLELSVRCKNCMNKAGIKTLAELTGYDVEALKKMRNFGVKSLEEIVGKIQALDLWFGMDERAWLDWGLAHLQLVKLLDWVNVEMYPMSRTHKR